MGKIENGTPCITSYQSGSAANNINKNSWIAQGVAGNDENFKYFFSSPRVLQQKINFKKLRRIFENLKASSTSLASHHSI